MPKCHQPLKFADLNSFLTKFCDNYQRHDYSSCLQWHSNMSPQFSNSEVKKKHLRRVPVIATPNGIQLAYENEKCPNPDTCPDKQKCKKCHNEKEFMYHPLVYMTAKCNYGTSCKNRSRFCAFYHTEAERIESEKNREDLLKKLKRQKSAKRTTAPEAVPSKWGIGNTATKVISQSDGMKQKHSSSDGSHSVSDEDNLGTNDESQEHDTADDTENILSQERQEGMSGYSQHKSSGNSSTDQISQSGGPFNSPPGNQYSSSGYPLRNNNGGYPRVISSGSQTQYPTASKQGMNFLQYSRINEKLRYCPSKILSQRVEGTIYEGLYLLHGIEYPVAVKEIRPLGTDPLINESLLKIRHRNIIRYHSVCYKNDSVYIVMDLHTTTLSSFLRDEASLLRSTDQGLTPLCKSLLHQLCSAIVYLQTEHQIAHCDLLPDNIFIEKHQDNNHCLILGDINRARVRQHCKDDNFITEREETYRYCPSKEWKSPEENSLPLFTQEQLCQSDMWKIGMLIYFIISGEQYSADLVPKFDANTQPWYALSRVLLQKDYMLRLSASSIMHHPAFWYFLPNRVGDFYKQILRGNLPVDITSLFKNVDSNVMLYPRNNWLNVIYPDNNFQTFSQNGSSVLRLIQLIVDVATRNQYKDEYYNSVIMQATKQRVDPIIFFQNNFPCLIFKIWELFFLQKKHLEKQKRAFSDLLSC